LSVEARASTSNLHSKASATLKRQPHYSSSDSPQFVGILFNILPHKISTGPPTGDRRRFHCTSISESREVAGRVRNLPAAALRRTMGRRLKQTNSARRRAHWGSPARTALYHVSSSFNSLINQWILLGAAGAYGCRRMWTQRRPPCLRLQKLSLWGRDSYVKLFKTSGPTHRGIIRVGLLRSCSMGSTFWRSSLLGRTRP